MALFGNQNKKTIEELENYYSGKQQRAGMAWVMAFLSLLLTVVVLGGLFFGGRWAYRTITDDDTNELATTSETSDSSVTANDDSDESTATLGDDNALSTDEDTTTTPDGTTTAGVVSDEAASTDEPSSVDEMTTVPETDNGPTPVTGDSSSTDEGTLGVETDASGELPNTGADSVLVIAPLLALVIGYYLSRRRQLKG